MRRLEAGRIRTTLLAAALALAACGSEPEPGPQRARIAPPTPVPAAEDARDVAVIAVAGFGDIRVELLDEVAPRTVDNFVELAERDFYAGTTFHRVIPDFAIQAGDPLTRDRDPRNDGQGGPGYQLEDEFSPISHVRGIVSMANRGRPGTAGSQFFILVGDSRPLDGKYTVFGHVVGGMEVVDHISRVERDKYGRRGPRDRPVENVTIESVRIERGAGGLAAAGRPEAGDPAGRIRISPGGANPSGGQAPEAGTALAPPAAPDPGGA